MASAFLPVVKKWGRMFQGTSVLHMEQGLGKYFEKGAIKGYYSDLRIMERVFTSALQFFNTDWDAMIYTWKPRHQSIWSASEKQLIGPLSIRSQAAAGTRSPLQRTARPTLLWHNPREHPCCSVHIGNLGMQNI